MIISHIKILFKALCLGSLLISCSKSGTSGESDTLKTTSNVLSKAFPGSLALSVFPKNSKTTLQLDSQALAGGTFDPNGQSLQEKIDTQEKVLNGATDSCLPSVLKKKLGVNPAESCYEFDQDMIYGTFDASQSNAYLGTQTGTSVNNEEACLVAFTRSQVFQVISLLDEVLGIGTAAFCQHKKINPDVSLPEIGSSIDLAPALQTLMSGEITLTSATLERLEDTNSKPVYKTIIKVALERDSIERTLGIIHSPFNDSNTQYSGTLYLHMGGLLRGGVGGKSQMMSVTYQQTLAGNSRIMKANLRAGQFENTLAADALDKTGELNYNVGTNMATAALGSLEYGSYTGHAQANDAVSDITYIAFDLNEDTNEGTLAYWKNPGGNYYENARGFNISISKNGSTGTLSGCATSGSASADPTFGVSIRRYLNPSESANSISLKPNGFYHPFFNSPTANSTDSEGDFFTRSQEGSGQTPKWYLPAIADTTMATIFVQEQTGSLITRQCFTQNTTTGLYEIDPSQTNGTAGYELLDTGNASHASKFIALPDAVSPVEIENALPDEEPAPQE